MAPGAPIIAAAASALTPVMNRPRRMLLSLRVSWLLAPVNSCAPGHALHRLLVIGRRRLKRRGRARFFPVSPSLLAQRCIPITDEAPIRIRSPEMHRARTLAPSPALGLRFVPILLVAAAGGSLAWREYGSIAAPDWLPYAIGCALLLATLLLSGVAARPATLAVAGLAGLLALGTLRTDGGRLGATAIVAGALAVLAVATALDLRLAAHPDELYFGGRLDSPVTYPNAAAALFLVGFWPAIGVAARRALPTLVRALGLGGATALLAGWLLAQ